MNLPKKKKKIIYVLPEQALFVLDMRLHMIHCYYCKKQISNCISVSKFFWKVCIYLGIYYEMK